MEPPVFSFDVMSLGETIRPDSSVVYDVLILGGGPAALSAAIYCSRKMMKSALVTHGFGGQMMDTSEVENYLGFQALSGKELADRFVEHVKKFDIPVAEGEKITSVRKEMDTFEVILQNGVIFRGRTVIYALGKNHRKLGVPGENELMGKGVVFCAVCDAPFYAAKKVVIVGGGNSALTAAIDLLKVGAEIILINYAHGWQGDAILLKAIQNRNVLMLDHHSVLRVDGENQVTAVRVRDHGSGEEKIFPCDGVFVEIGLVANTDPIRQLAKLNSAGDLIVDCRCQTSVVGLFGAGDATTVPYNQIVISAGEGAKAALSSYDFLLRYE